MQFSAPLASPFEPSHTAGALVVGRPSSDRRNSVPMKMVTAVILPSRLDAVLDALNSGDIGGVIVSEVSGPHADGELHSEVYRGAAYAVRLTPRIKFEIAAAEDDVDRILEVIANAAQMDHAGAGLILVTDLEGCVRIRSGDRPL